MRSSTFEEFTDPDGFIGLRYGLVFDVSDLRGWDTVQRSQVQVRGRQQMREMADEEAATTKAATRESTSIEGVSSRSKAPFRYCSTAFKSIGRSRHWVASREERRADEKTSRLGM